MVVLGFVEGKHRLEMGAGFYEFSKSKEDIGQPPVAQRYEQGVSGLLSQAQRLLSQRSRALKLCPHIVSGCHLARDPRQRGGLARLLA